MEDLALTRRARIAARSVLAFAVALALNGTASAQSNASGTIFGHSDGGGPGSTVHIQNLDTGMTRDVAIGNDGRFRAGSLPVGRYRVSLQRDGKELQSRDHVQVTLGSGVDVSFGPIATPATTTTAKDLASIKVTGNALPAIDVSSTDSRTVLTSDQLQKLPLARNVTAAALLAPGVIAGDSRYGNVASFGGSSAAENQYYINGYAVTNALTGLGFVSLPYDAIDQQQIYTGGYGAEYGRSTGGVISVVTKRGGNTWKAGGQVFWQPAGLRDSPRDIYLRDGELYQVRSNNKANQSQYTGYISGPLIKDKLFMYLAGDFTRNTTSYARSSDDGQFVKENSQATKWLAKVDWNITDSHILELTALSDKNSTTDQIYAYDYQTLTRGDYRGKDQLRNTDSGAGSQPGGNVYIAKYTGYITDDLTINALYGKSKTKHVRDFSYAGSPNCPWVSDDRAATAGNRQSGCGIVGSGSQPVLRRGAQDRTRGWRFDVDYQLGPHALRAGVDNQVLESHSGKQYEGGDRWFYHDYDPQSGPGAGIIVPDGTQWVVDHRTFITDASVKVEQEAQFIEDHWQINDRWMAYLGLRNEQFKNFNGDGDVYVKQRHQLAPRLGLTWDVFGDSSFKLYANAGRYHLAVPSNVAIRGASASLYSSEYYTFKSIDPVTGLPQGLQVARPTRYLNAENGTTPDPKTVAARNLSAYYQDEYILGFDKALATNWTFGAKLTYRKLRSSIDDVCDSRPFEKWLTNHGYDPDNAIINGCYLFNPGKTNKFLVDVDGNGNYQEVKLTKDDFTTPEGAKFPDLKRKYYALDLYLEHQFDQRWYGRINYTFSRSYGNSEGQLKSDIGQLDPSVTQDWDAPEIMTGTNGPLPNDRTHQLKAYGYFQATPEWLFGANLSIASGRPKNCFGVNPVDPIGYENAYLYCDGKISPRGSRGRLPYTWQLDLNTEYRPNWADGRLAFNATVYNVFTQQRQLSIIETGETATGAPNVNYQRTVSYQTPRYFQLGVRYDFSL